MITRIDRYVGRYYLTSWFVSVLFFVGLLMVYEVFAKIDELLEEMGRKDIGVGIILRLYAYRAPDILLKMAPFIMVMAALVAALRLQRHREYVAMVMTGNSPRRVLRPVYWGTVVLVGALVVLQEIIAPRVALDRDRLDAELFEKSEQWIIEDITMRDATGQLIVAQDFNVSRGVVGRLTVSAERSDGRNVHIEGEDATYDERAGGWRLQAGTSEVQVADRNAPPLIDDAAFVETDVRPEDLLVDSRQPFDLSYTDVLDLSRRYPNSRRYRLLRHYHVTYPISVLLLVYLVVPFVLRHDPRSRLRGLGLALLLALGLKILDTTVWDLGSRGFMQPVLAAWLPVIVTGSLVAVLYDAGER